MPLVSDVRATATCRKRRWDERLSESESKKLQRGDLIFWEGHVAIVRDAETIVHANAHHMATAVENTRAAIARIKAAGSEVTSIKRL